MKRLLRRLGFYILTAWAAVTMNFLIPRLMPGNPVELLMARFQGRMTPSAIRGLKALFGLNHAGLWSQYVTYWRGIFHGNLGLSFTYFPTPVIQVIERSLPWTVVLVGISTILSFAIGTLLGVVVAWRRGSILDSLLPVTTFFSSIPYFWFGLIVLTILGLDLKWFPTSGGSSSSVATRFSGPFIASAIYHGILPAVTIVISSMAIWLMRMRNMMVMTLADDYVRMAEAKGLSQGRVMFIYAARNAVLPNVASFAMALGFIVSGSILVEIVFSYPGIGYVLYQAVSNEDYPLMQGIFLVITLVVLIANFLADLCYAWLDPRTRQEA